MAVHAIIFKFATSLPMLEIYTIY